MKHEIIKQIKNPSLCREEFFLKVISEKNPTKKEVIELIGKDEALCAIKQIKGSFGKEEFDVDIVVYDNIEAKNNVEVIGRKVKRKMEENAKKAGEEKKVAEAKAKAEEAKKAEEVTKEETKTKEVAA